MNVTVNIHPNETTREGFAPVELRLDNGTKLCSLDLQYSVLAQLPRSNPVAVDFLLIAAAVYAIDKLFKRDNADDAWTRIISLTIPVSNVACWKAVEKRFDRCLSFLTGDIWTLNFGERENDPIRPQRRRRRVRRNLLNRPPRGDTVSLFSGGLDSLVGVIDWLEENRQRNLLLVGHHESDIPGPFDDQRALLGRLHQAYPGRITSLLVRVGHTDEGSDDTEITLRGRSLIFVALGIFAASAIGPAIPLIVPENGTIALNVPLTPSRRGSCSTRTAHPRYLAILSEILAAVGLANSISNPLRHRTKGEVLQLCRNQNVLHAAAHLAVSCAKRGHKVHWTRRSATSCGRCMPCIYRRAAMHLVGWDDEVYGDDICAGEVDLAANAEKPNDLRACLSFLRKNPNAAEIATMLMASGSLDIRGLDADAEMVRRTMDEIRNLIRNKGTADIKRLAGL